MSDQEGEQPKVWRQHRFTLPPGATDLLVVRHGESEPAVEGVAFPEVEGHADPALAPEGREQAERLAERLSVERIDAVYVTLLRRTHETAAPLAARLGLTPRVEPDLTEIHLGEWEVGGLFRKHTSELHPLALQVFAEQRWDLIPGAESNEALQERVVRGIGRIVAAHPDQRVLVVAHGGVIASLFAWATGSQPFAFLGSDNASLSQLVATHGRYLLRRFNDTTHLQPELTLTAAPVT